MRHPSRRGKDCSLSHGESLELRLAPGGLLGGSLVPDLPELSDPLAESALVDSEYQEIDLHWLTTDEPIQHPPEQEAQHVASIDAVFHEMGTPTMGTPSELTSLASTLPSTSVGLAAVSLIPLSPVNGDSSFGGMQMAMTMPPPMPPPPGGGGPTMPPPPPPMNMPPTTWVDTYFTQHGVPLVVGASNGVLANDTDPEGAALTATLFSGPQYGTVELHSDGSFIWTPDEDFGGMDWFRYQASDGVNTSLPQMVSLLAMNQTAMPVPDVYWMATGTTLYVDAPGVLANDGVVDADGITVRDPDGDKLTLKVKSGPEHHSDWHLFADGHFDYTPEEGFIGVDTFAYWVDDGIVERPIDVRPETVVTVHVREPKIDIDTDTNNSGGIDSLDDPDGGVIPFEEQTPGNILWLNNTDDNGNGEPDYADDGPFTNTEGELVADLELEPAMLAINPDMVPITKDWKVVINHDPNLRIWKDVHKHEFSSLEFSAIDDPEVEDDNFMPQTIWVEGLEVGVGQVWVEFFDPHGQLVDTDRTTFSVVRFDLSVNGDDDLGDPGDLAVNYLPGYYLDEPQVSVGTTWTDAQYVGQRMRLVLEGLGASPHIEKVTFNLLGTSAYDGYAMNKSDPAVEGIGKFNDYSFKLAEDDIEEEGTMLSDRTVVDFYAKDYAGWATVSLVITATGGGLTYSRTLQIPVDEDLDTLADLWERRNLPKDAEWGWADQFNDPITTDDLDWYNPGDDLEYRDPDANDTDGGHNMPAHLFHGDLLKVWEEYRGYIADGNGFSFAGGHTRLLPWYKELLVQADMMAQPEQGPQMPMPSEAEIRSIMNVAAAGMGDLTNGAGLLMYWVLDETAAGPHVSQYDQLEQWRSAHNNTDELEDFHWVGFADVALPHPSLLGATPTKMESYVFVTNVKAFADDRSVDYHSALASTVAHELTHQITFHAGGGFVQNPVDGFDSGGHVLNPDPTDPPGSPEDDWYLMGAGGANQRSLSAIIYDDLTRSQINLRR